MGTAPAPNPFVFNFPTEQHENLLTIRNPYALGPDEVDSSDDEDDYEDDRGVTRLRDFGGEEEVVEGATFRESDEAARIRKLQ